MPQTLRPAIDPLRPGLVSPSTPSPGPSFFLPPPSLLPSLCSSFASFKTAHRVPDLAATNAPHLPFPPAISPARSFCTMFGQSALPRLVCSTSPCYSPSPASPAVVRDALNSVETNYGSGTDAADALVSIQPQPRPQLSADDIKRWVDGSGASVTCLALFLHPCDNVAQGESTLDIELEPAHHGQSDGAQQDDLHDPRQSRMEPTEPESAANDHRPVKNCAQHLFQSPGRAQKD